MVKITGFLELSHYLSRKSCPRVRHISSFISNVRSKRLHFIRRTYPRQHRRKVSPALAINQFYDASGGFPLPHTHQTNCLLSD